MRILAFIDHYLPGFRHGGPITTISNLVESMPEGFDFWLLTRDRDQGDAVPYPGVVRDTWTRVGRAMVFYASPPRVHFRSLAALVRALRPEVVYANSLFSRLTIRYVVARRLGLLPEVPFVLAPRGELASSALSIKPLRKRAYVVAGQAVGLFDGVLWQASTDLERDDVLRALSGQARVRVSCNVHVAPDLTLAGERLEAEGSKEPGRMRLVYLSRIAPVKNLLGAAGFLPGGGAGISLDVYGPVEDAGYWAACQEAFARQAPALRVEYRGVLPRAEVRPTLRRYDFLLLPTAGENFGHVIAEALSAGCPPIISDQTPWRQLAQANAGFDLPLDRPDAWRDVLGRCLAMDGESHALMREQAVRLAATAHDREAALRQNVELFRTALATHWTRR